MKVTPDETALSSFFLTSILQRNARTGSGKPAENNLSEKMFSRKRWSVFRFRIDLERTEDRPIQVELGNEDHCSDSRMDISTVETFQK
jgi:hypothetical protein